MTIAADTAAPPAASDANSQDSRYTGFVWRQQIQQRAVWIYFSRDWTTGGTRWGRIGGGVR